MAPAGRPTEWNSGASRTDSYVRSLQLKYPLKQNPPADTFGVSTSCTDTCVDLRSIDRRRNRSENRKGQGNGRQKSRITGTECVLLDKQTLHTPMSLLHTTV
ncbi:uncharacterized protein [Temnothorax longispinosus]|uniref:uncharacterized protein n=1 Tax=Temnothorax longispinosus TaxID=300112 RepID=UPI003A9949DE